MLKNKRLAIIRLSSVGDVLHGTPVARAVKKYAPDCHITWVVGSVSAGVLAGNPYIDEVYVWSREHWEALLRAGQFRAAAGYWRKLKRDLHARQLDIALDIHGIFISGLVTIASGAPLRIGMSGTREFNSFFINETAIRLPSETHVIERYLSILRPLGVPPDGPQMTLIVSPTAKRFADSLLRTAGVFPGQRLIALCPRTTWAAKNWPEEYFAAAAQQLSSQGRLLLCGGQGDKETAREITRQAGVPIINTVGQTNLQQLAALLNRCDVLLTGDTGPLHMAIALGTPTVSLFGPTDPAVYGPIVPGHVVLQKQLNCRPCNKQHCRLEGHQCLYGLSPDTAVKAVLWQLKQKAADPV